MRRFCSGANRKVVPRAIAHIAVARLHVCVQPAGSIGERAQRCGLRAMLAVVNQSQRNVCQHGLVARLPQRA